VENFLEKALETANLMTNLANQKRALKEEFEQTQIFFYNGGTFTITTQLITFVNFLISKGYTGKVPLIDNNGVPILVENLDFFLDSLLDLYFQSTNKYYHKYEAIRQTKDIKNILDL
jgi:hypothetical protein